MVSIIIPIYNSEKYLRQCIASALAQTYSDIEVILVDDGSTDSSPSICERAARDSGKIKVVHKKNGGPSSARNTGLKRARGKYVVFLDADDILHPMFVELSMHQVMQTSADVVAWKFREFSDENKLYSSIPMIFPLQLDRLESVPSREYAPEKAFLLMMYQKRLNASACGKLFKASLWRERRFREDTRYEDLDVVPIVVHGASLVSYINIPLYFYRMHPDSYLHTFSLQRADVLGVTERLVEYARQYPELLPSTLDRHLSACFNIMLLLHRNRSHVSTEDRPEAARISLLCKHTIRRLRGGRLLDPRVRLKNKLAILLTYLLPFSLK